MDADVDEASLAALGRARTLTTGCGGASASGRIETPTGCLRINTTTSFDPRAILAACADLQHRSELYRRTGCVHAAALALPDGRLLDFAEDVGRHNAVDKVIGACWLAGHDLGQCFLVTTGRLSSEIAAKTISAKIPMLVSRGAPTSAAVRLAERFLLTLVGFVRGGRMNVYAYPERIAGLSLVPPLGGCTP